MSYEITSFLSEYGYLAILILVFLQETGLPGPVPNEFLLLFSGYLIYTGTLFFPYVLLSAVLGDLMAGSLLYAVFYFFGPVLIRYKPTWFSFPRKKIKAITLKIQTSGQTGILIGRLSPFVRGWVAVLSGFLHFSTRKYAATLLLTSTLWVAVYITIGYFISPYFNIYLLKVSGIGWVPVIISAGIIAGILMVRVIKNRIPTFNKFITKQNSSI